jgi:hypothetical protein
MDTVGISNLVDCAVATVNGNHSCNLENQIHSTMQQFIAHNGWKVGASEMIMSHPSRPMAPVGADGLAHSAIGCIFWISFTISKFLKLADFGAIADSIQRSPIVAASMEKRAEDAFKWDVITTVFPTFEKWRDDVGHSKQFRSMIKALCPQVKEDDAGADEKLQSCWDAKKSRSKQEISIWSQMSVVPQSIAACFAFALILRDGALASNCQTSGLRDKYQCTNGAFRNSMCVMVCKNTIRQIDNAVLIRRTIPRGVSHIMVCGVNGKWVGGPFGCDEQVPGLDDDQLPRLSNDGAR